MTSVFRGAPHSSAHIPDAAILGLAGAALHHEITVAHAFYLLVTWLGPLNGGTDGTA